MNIERTTHTIDATDKTVGRLSTEIATLLIGKHKPSYMPNMDMGDFVKIENAGAMVFTGKKMEQKAYYRHSMHPGGLKTTLLKHLWKKDPSEVLRKAVSRMLPKNKLRNERMKRLVIKN